MKNSKRRKRFEVAPPVTRGRRKRLVVQALTEEVWTLCLEFTIDKVQTWSSMQLVSKEFHRCLRKARALSHFLFHLYRVESLERLGVSATGIRRLKLGLTRCDNITDANLQALSSLVALETLSLGGCSRIIDLQALAPLVVLKTLNLAGCFSIIGLQALAPLVALETLNLDFCDKITDGDLKALAPLVALKTLNLCYCDKITNVGLQAVARLVALQALNLAGCKITDVGLQAVAPLLALKKLSLSWCDSITDAGLQALAPLQALQALDLDYCNEISDRGLRLALAPLKALQMLNIRGCTKITDRLHLDELRLSWRYERWYWDTHERDGRFS